MRQENIEITIKIPIDFGKPDKNGVIYTRKAVEIALDSYSSCPIVFLDNEGNEKVIGVTDEHRAELIKENGKYKIVKSGIIYYGGTCENIIFDFSKKDGTVKYYGVGNIGFSE